MFKNAKFGTPYKTREGEIRLFNFIDELGFVHLCGECLETTVTVHQNGMFLNNGTESDEDIIGMVLHEVDEQELSIRAKEDTSFILDTAIREKVIGEECYKIGFRKAVELYG